MRFTTSPNRFKQRLAAREQLFGLWVALGDGIAAELLAGCGYDWLLIDGEHGPNDLRTLLAQLQGVASATAAMDASARHEVSHPIVRVPHGSPDLLKQVLELGARTLMVPMVETAEQARDLVRAVRYPPHGIRGMGSALARSSNWGRTVDYVARSDENICLIVQVETRRGIENAEAIAAVEGVDLVFFGPADLSADLGLGGDTTHPEVVDLIVRTAERVRAAGTPTGTLIFDPAKAGFWLDAGMTFLGVGADTTLLSRAADALLAQVRSRHA